MGVAGLWASPGRALAQLGAALKFYDISFLYAPTPQAKGKIEREHQFWQKRLPPYFASEEVTELDDANIHIDARNAHETHRELKKTAQCAWPWPKRKRRAASTRRVQTVVHRSSYRFVDALVQ